MAMAVLYHQVLTSPGASFGYVSLPWGLTLLWVFLGDLKLLYLNRHGRSSQLQLQSGGGDFEMSLSPGSLSRDLCVTGGCGAAW